MIRPTPRIISPLCTEVLQFDDLRELSGFHRIDTVERWAKSQGIRYKQDGKGGIWTTITALNVALGVCKDITGNEPYDF